MKPVLGHELLEEFSERYQAMLDLARKHDLAINYKITTEERLEHWIEKNIIEPHKNYQLIANSISSGGLNINTKDDEQALQWWIAFSLFVALRRFVPDAIFPIVKVLDTKVLSSVVMLVCVVDWLPSTLAGESIIRLSVCRTFADVTILNFHHTQ